LGRRDQLPELGRVDSFARRGKGPATKETAMIKISGLRFSNYYSLTKAVMVEKGIEFEEVKHPPSQDEDYLGKSPMGKMPYIEVDGKYMSESLAITSFLERAYPEPALLPDDPFAAGKVMELCCHCKLDVEVVARRCLPALLFGTPVSEETKEQVRADLPKGMAAVRKLFQGAPFAAGNELTLADFYLYYCLGTASGLAQAVAGVDLLADDPAIQECLARLAAHPSIARVTAEAARKKKS